MLSQREFRCGLVLFAGSLLSAAGHARAESIRVFGSEGPFPPIQEAALAFQANQDVKVEIVSGPVPRWLEQAKGEADLIFCSAEFMMTNLLQEPDLRIAAETVTPLYSRPSAILVRPGNPLGIRDFPDLLRPGVRVMVVNGSGQTGLWEDMVGKRGSVETTRAFKKNVVFFAPDSDTASRAWKERDDIDAWVTWSIWHLPLHKHSELITVSEDFVIHRSCCAALTERGKTRPQAAALLRFLASEEGEAIFETWGWTPPSPAKGAVAVRADVAVVCQIGDDGPPTGPQPSFAGVLKLVNGYRAANVAADQLHVVAVVHDGAVAGLLNNGRYREVTNSSADNPNEAVIRELLAAGVRVEVCAQTLARHGWSTADLLPGVEQVPDGYARIVDLQIRGHAYLRL